VNPTERRQRCERSLLIGSASLASSLLKANLSHEYRVILEPVVLGSGHPLFKSIDERMKLMATHVLGTGVVVLYSARLVQERARSLHLVLRHLPLELIKESPYLLVGANLAL
jgi:dihydrofolate reductase